MDQMNAMSMMSNMFNPMMAAFIQQLAAQSQSMQQPPNNNILPPQQAMVDPSLGGGVGMQPQQWNQPNGNMPLPINSGGYGAQQQHSRFNKQDKNF